MSFSTSHLTIDQKIDLCRKAHAKCFEWWVDILDMKGSMQRKRIEMSLDDILSKLRDDSHFFVIHRNYSLENHLEIGFRTFHITDTDYYLWIQLDAELIPEFLALIEEKT